MYKGPGNQERASQPNEELPLSIWHKSQTTLGHIGDAKSGHCSSLVVFNSWILHYFSPYFDGLKGCCCDLRHLFFGRTEEETRKDVGHDKVVEVLQRTLSALQPEHPVKNVVNPMDLPADLADVLEGSNADWEEVQDEVEETTDVGEQSDMSDDNDEMEAVEEEMEDEKNHPQNDDISQLQCYISQRHNQYHSSSRAHSSSPCFSASQCRLQKLM